MLKTVLERLPSDTHKFVINRVVPQQVNMCKDSMHPPFMMLLQLLLAIQLNLRHCRSAKKHIMHRVNEIHRLYDALQYPIIYWQGQDGYRYNTHKLIIPIIGFH